MTSQVPPLFDNEPPRESRRKRLARLVVALIVVAAAATGATVWWNDRPDVHTPIGTAFAAQTDSLARAPKGVRVRVRVLNASNVNGLAKRATSVLRDHGFDVVEYEGVMQKTPRAATLVQTHTGHDDWSDRVIRVLGTGTTETRADSSRFVDLTVILGVDWKAPAQAFRP
ncbi:MAG: LytR C-terminal domain-containing protein [Gemmatimonadaceae bacterium]